MKTLKGRKDDSIPYGACVMPKELWCMTLSYWKTSVFVRQYVNEKTAFSRISTLENVFEKMHLRWQNSLNTYVWQEDKPVNKTKPDTCGQGLSGVVEKYNANSTLLERKYFFVFVLFVSLSFSLELPRTTTTKVTPASKYPMKIKV